MEWPKSQILDLLSFQSTQLLKQIKIQRFEYRITSLYVALRFFNVHIRFKDGYLGLRHPDFRVITRRHSLFLLQTGSRFKVQPIHSFQPIEDKTHSQSGIERGDLSLLINRRKQKNQHPSTQRTTIFQKHIQGGRSC